MMFSTQGAIASSGFNFDFSDEIVVVGRVPLNKKRGQRQLTRIAQAQEERSWSQDRPTRNQKDRRGKHEDRPTQNRQPKHQPVVQRPPIREAPLRTQPRRDQKHAAPLLKQPKRDQKHEVQCRITVGAAARCVAVVEFPAETLAHLASFAGVAAMGGLCATGRSAYQSLWGPQSLAFWRGLGARAGPEEPWNAFRITHFGLGAGWQGSLASLIAADPLSGLERAARIAPALLRAEHKEAAGLVVSLTAAARAAPPAPALAIVDAVLPKLRPQVFGSLQLVERTRAELEEKRILAEIDQQEEREHEALLFDYFEAPAEIHEPANFWDELENLAITPKPQDERFDEHEAPEPPRDIPEAESRLLAAEFLEALGLRHGFAWQETAAAITA